MRAGTSQTTSRPSARRGGVRHVEMADVNRIERAAEEAAPSSRSGDSRAAGDFAPHRFEQRRHAFAGDAPRSESSGTCRASQVLRSRFEPIRIVQRVDLVRGGDLRLGRERDRRVVAGAREQLELAADDLEVLDRIAARRRRHVDHVHEHLRAFEVREELRAEAVALVRAFDQPGHVGHDEAIDRRCSGTTPRLGVSVVNG